MEHQQTITGHCDHGIGCSLTQPGHKLQYYMRRLAEGHLRGWVDAQVVGFTAAWAVLEDWTTGKRFSVWNHEDLRVDLSVGDLVAVNRKHSVLAIADERVSVMLTEESVL